MRDCANCFHRKPVLKEDGTWTAECEKWDCEFQSRENMIEKTKAMDNDLISREYIRKALNEAFGCENATKYGNKNADQQAKSYSTLMLYEIADTVEDVCDNAPRVENEELRKIRNICEHWNDKSSSFVSACNAFEDILAIFGLGVTERTDMRGEKE